MVRPVAKILAKTKARVERLFNESRMVDCGQTRLALTPNLSNLLSPDPGVDIVPVVCLGMGGDNVDDKTRRGVLQANQDGPLAA
ncbi:MAG: hypothetical protein ACRD1T_07390 [Acidimicrobiia bacterium]